MRANWRANPNEKNTVATEIGGSLGSARNRFAMRSIRKKIAIVPSAEST